MKRRGFTIIELIIVIIVIGILSTLTIVVFSQYQKQAQDNVRKSDATTVADGLEKYYSKNGEYPSCSQLTGSPSSVTGTGGALQGVNPDALVSPGASAGTTNSIKCQDLTSPSQGDYYAYVGDGSSNCTGSNSCLQFTLKWVNTATGTIGSISSQHKESVTTSGTLTLSMSGTTETTTSASWNAVQNATSYTLQRATNSAFTSGVVNTSVSSTSQPVTGLTSGVAYYFRVAAVNSGIQGAWSNTVNVVTILDTPTGNAIAITSATTFKQTWNSNAAATSYNVHCSTDNVNWGSCTANTTATSFSYSGALQGYKYYVQVQAATASTTSAWSSSASGITPINTPSVPGWANTTSMTASVQGGAYYYYPINYYTYCPSGTSVVNGNFTSTYTPDGSQFNHPFGYTDYWYLPYGQSSITVIYNGRYQCGTSYATSGVSGDSSTSVNVHS